MKRVKFHVFLSISFLFFSFTDNKMEFFVVIHCLIYRKIKISIEKAPHGCYLMIYVIELLLLLLLLLPITRKQTKNLDPTLIIFESFIINYTYILLIVYNCH